MRQGDRHKEEQQNEGAEDDKEGGERREERGGRREEGNLLDSAPSVHSPFHVLSSVREDEVRTLVVPPGTAA
jgi:hypothetical protein